MSKVQQEFAAAWAAGKAKTGRLNADGTRQYETDGVDLRYRGTVVATRLEGGVFVTLAGWPTRTTMSVVNEAARAAAGVGRVVWKHRGAVHFAPTALVVREPFLAALLSLGGRPDRGDEWVYVGHQGVA